jgi:hypothetical protein
MRRYAKKLQKKAKKAVQSPAGRRALTSLKPSKTVWGFLGIVLFFIAPEVVAFIWGEAIAAHASEQLPLASSTALSYYYEGLAMLFENGVSWVNLLVGIALLVWFFF